MDKKEIHECKFYKGKIIDVTVRNNSKTIHCRMCGEELKEDEVDPKTLKDIKKDWKLKYGF